jgi:hypothetical protein
MAIKFRIDVVRRVVWMQADGILNDSDVFQYIEAVWSQPEVAGFHEFADLTGVTGIDLPSAARVRELAALSAAMEQDAPPARLAILAIENTVFGICKMYEARHRLEKTTVNEVAVFRSREAALTWLGLDGVTCPDFSEAEQVVC